MDAQKLLGRAPADLTLEETERLRGNWIALEIYTPATMPLRRIEAVAADPAGCVAELRRRQLDPRDFEFVLFQGRP